MNYATATLLVGINTFLVDFTTQVFVIKLQIVKPTQKAVVLNNKIAN